MIPYSTPQRKCPAGDFLPCSGKVRRRRPNAPPRGTLGEYAVSGYLRTSANITNLFYTQRLIPTLIPTLIQHFIRLAFCLQRAQYLVEHEVDKRTRIALSCGFTNSIVVLALMRPYNIFDRRTVEFIAPGAKKRRLPETSRPSVAVWERMDELELVMRSEERRVGKECL